MLSVKPLRSTGITLLLRYYGLLRPPLRPVQPLCIPLGLFLLAGLPGSSVVLSTHAVPFHPGEPDDCLLSFLRHQYWFRHIRQGVHSHWFNEAVSGSLALRLASLSHEASPGRITPPCARLTTYVTSNSYDELLSAHENNQACPGAPDFTEKSKGKSVRSVKSVSRITATPKEPIFQPAHIASITKNRPGAY